MIIIAALLFCILITYIVLLVNYCRNSKIKLGDGLIESQRDEPACLFRFGVKKSSCNGCGWIASYNALHLLSNKKMPQYIIALLELSIAPVAFGFFGTNPFSIALLFRILGYKVTLCRIAPDVNSYSHNAGIALYFTKNLHAHYVAFSKCNDAFVIHNPNKTVRDFAEYLEPDSRRLAIVINISHRQKRGNN